LAANWLTDKKVQLISVKSEQKPFILKEAAGEVIIFLLVVHHKNQIELLSRGYPVRFFSPSRESSDILFLSPTGTLQYCLQSREIPTNSAGFPSSLFPCCHDKKQTCGIIGGVSDRLCNPSQLKPSNHLCFWTACSLSMPYPSRSVGLSLHTRKKHRSKIFLKLL